jgi:hypothetical protein
MDLFFLLSFILFTCLIFLMYMFHSRHLELIYLDQMGLLLLLFQDR